MSRPTIIISGRAGTRLQAYAARGAAARPPMTSPPIICQPTNPNDTKKVKAKVRAGADKQGTGLGVQFPWGGREA